MPKKLAITISGAVSLGSYEAGVLYEVIRAIGLHNSNQNPATPEADKIYIDVLTGASAGGMTATIAAQKLMYEAGALDGATTNAFYLPWVAEIGIERLLQTTGTPDDNMSIFSSAAVVEISEKFLTARYSSQMTPAVNRHPAADATNLKLGLAMTNLNGLDYATTLRPAGSLIYTKFADQLVKEFDVTRPALDDNETVWEALRNVAVSCGAFPLAFKVVEVTRHAEEYQADPPITPMGDPQNFAYTDGGVFQNEPVSLAKLLVDKIDKHQEQANRFYLFVAPDLRKSAANSTFNDQNATLLNTAKQLAGVVFNQGRFPDLLNAEELNQEVGLLNTRALQLRDLLNAKDAATVKLANSMQATADVLLPALFTGEPAKALPDAQARLKQQFAAEYDTMEPSTRDTWIDSILTLERAADLGDTDEMTIYSIIAADTELASTGLVAFAGFFDRACREHDYLVGRQKAQTFLKTAGVFGIAGGLNCTFEDVPVPDPALNGLILADMDEGVREDVRNRLIDRTNELMKEAGIDWVIAGPIVRSFLDIFIRKKLDDLLEL
jgi:predicted acylesterase/phospholipase RssA